MEIFDDTMHQSHEVIVETQAKPLDAKAVPFTPKGKNHMVTFTDIVKWTPNNDSRPSLPTPIRRKWPIKTPAKKDPNSSDKSRKSEKKVKSQQHISEKMISIIMTGYKPILKDNVREIVVYDIPSKWTQLEILNYLKAWGNILAMKFKTQKKYVTVTISIDLNDAALSQWNEGVWTVPLEGLPIR